MHPSLAINICQYQFNYGGENKLMISGSQRCLCFVVIGYIVVNVAKTICATDVQGEGLER